MNSHTPPDHCIELVLHIYLAQCHMFYDVPAFVRHFAEVFGSNHTGTNNIQHYGGFPYEILPQFPHRTLFHISSFLAGHPHLYLLCLCARHHNKNTTSLDGDVHVSNSALYYSKPMGSGHISTCLDLDGHWLGDLTVFPWTYKHLNMGIEMVPV